MWKKHQYAIFKKKNKQTNTIVRSNCITAYVCVCVCTCMWMHTCKVPADRAIGKTTGLSTARVKAKSTYVSSIALFVILFKSITTWRILWSFCKMTGKLKHTSAHTFPAKRYRKKLISPSQPISGNTILHRFHTK